MHPSLLISPRLSHPDGWRRGFTGYLATLSSAHAALRQNCLAIPAIMTMAEMDWTTTAGTQKTRKIKTKNRDDLRLPTAPLPGGRDAVVRCGRVMNVAFMAPPFYCNNRSDLIEG
jgi:hypothetical protein